MEISVSSRSYLEVSKQNSISKGTTANVETSLPMSERAICLSSGSVNISIEGFNLLEAATLILVNGGDGEEPP
ncbi:MAG: hypothetical protein HRT38_10565 [Alteromonadaceae bacterium]|nr:hypothetical protein [Alteromonadaceae bacterium]